MGALIVFISAMFVDLFVDVFYLNLHIYNFSLKIKGIVEFEGSHYLFIVFLLFELSVDEKDKLFVADCSVWILVQDLLHFCYYFRFQWELHQFLFYLLGTENAITIWIYQSEYILGVFSLGKADYKFLYGC